MQRDELEPGMPVWWLYTPRGGYGYTERVIAVVIKPGKKRIGIAALLADRVTWVPKWVDPGNLRERPESED